MTDKADTGGEGRKTYWEYGEKPLLTEGQITRIEEVLPIMRGHNWWEALYSASEGLLATVRQLQTELRHERLLRAEAEERLAGLRTHALNMVSNGNYLHANQYDYEAYVALYDYMQLQGWIARTDQSMSAGARGDNE